MVDGLETSPAAYFAPGAWPAGRPRRTAPEECLYAAEFANYLQRRALTLAREDREAREAADKARPGNRPAKPRRRPPPSRIGPDGRPLESLTEGLRLLSPRLDIPTSTLSDIARGKRWPTLAMVARAEMREGRALVDYGIVLARSRANRSLEPAPPVERRAPRPKKRRTSLTSAHTVGGSPGPGGSRTPTAGASEAAAP